MGNYTTTAELLAKVGDRKSIDAMIDAVNSQFPGGKKVFTDDDVASYIREHPMETLGKPRDEIEKLMRAEWKPAKDELVKAKMAEGTRASDNRARSGQLRMADAFAARRRSAEGTFRKARLARNQAREVELGNTKPNGTFEDRRERTERGKEIIADKSWLGER